MGEAKLTDMTKEEIDEEYKKAVYEIVDKIKEAGSQQWSLRFPGYDNTELKKVLIGAVCFDVMNIVEKEL